MYRGSPCSARWRSTSQCQKDVDALVTIDAAMDLSSLARFGRRLKGTAQTINLGADIFLGDGSDHYLGRIATTESVMHA